MNNMYTSFDIFQYPNLLHLDPMLFPPIISKKDGKLQVKTIVKHNKTMNASNNISTEKSDFLSLWLIFDWENELKKECVFGECELSKLDTVIYIRIYDESFLSDNAYKIEYIIDMAADIYKYIIENKQYMYNKEKERDRVSIIRDINIIPLEDFLNKFIIPYKLQNFISKNFLIGGRVRISNNGIISKKILSENDVQLKEPKDIPIIEEYIEGFLPKLIDSYYNKK